MIELRRDEMTTKLKNKEQTSNPMVAIAADPTKTTFSFRDVIEEGSPIDTWATIGPPAMPKIDWATRGDVT